MTDLTIEQAARAYVAAVRAYDPDWRSASAATITDAHDALCAAVDAQPDLEADTTHYLTIEEGLLGERIVTPEERAKLRELAEAATPGPWGVFDGCVWTEPGECVTHSNRADAQNAANLAHIAAANPTAALALLDALDAAEARLAAVRAIARRVPAGDYYWDAKAADWRVRGRLHKVRGQWYYQVPGDGPAILQDDCRNFDKAMAACRRDVAALRRVLGCGYTLAPQTFADLVERAREGGE